MRGGLCVLTLVAACAPHFDRAAHSGRDAEVWGAHPLDLDPDEREARARGIVTARGGDADDWYAFEVPDRPGCAQKVKVRLRWRTPRPELRLALAVYDRYQRRIAHTDRAHRARTAVLVAQPGDRYFVKVSAPRPDDAGEYKLDVRTEIWGACIDVEPESIDLDRPDGYWRPRLVSTPDHEIADVSRIRIEPGDRRVSASIAVGTDDAIDARWWGHLVDEGGNDIPESTFLVRDAGAKECTAIFLHPAAVAEAAERGDLWPSGILVELDHGRADGVARGWRGELAYASGVRVPGGSFVVIDVDLHRSIGVVTRAVLTDRDHLHAVLTSP